MDIFKIQGCRPKPFACSGVVPLMFVGTLRRTDKCLLILQALGGFCCASCDDISRARREAGATRGLFCSPVEVLGMIISEPRHPYRVAVKL